MNGQTTYGQAGRTDNKVLPKAGLNGFDWTFVRDSTFVLRLNFCAKNPRLRQYPNRLEQCSSTCALSVMAFDRSETTSTDRQKNEKLPTLRKN